MQRIGFIVAGGFQMLGVARADGFWPEAAVGLRWRLFDFGRVDAEVAQAKS
jgi:hypothetical protein